MRRFQSLSLLLCTAGGLWAQMTPEQRSFDFEVLTSLYAKRYAPYQWKRDALNADLYNLSSWRDRVRKASSDLEYYEIAMEYVAAFQDTHSHYRMPTSFSADLGLFTDIYDGKVLIDGINRAVLPLSRYPFQVGDEVVSIDGVSSEDIIASNSKYYRWGNPDTTRRYAAYFIPYRPQTIVPRAVELGDTASVVIRRAGGDLETYTILWNKTGLGLTNIGPVPSPAPAATSIAKRRTAREEAPDYMRPLLDMQNWTVPEWTNMYRGEIEDDAGNVTPRYAISLGNRSPNFRLPANFVQRLGRSASDFQFSGTYESGGYKIGYLRVPSFSPPSTAIRELDTEIDYLQKNTDGLVLDVMQNPGGGCYMADLAARFMPGKFYFFGEQVRPTMDRILSAQSALDTAKALRAEQWVIDTYQFLLGMLQDAYKNNRGLTGAYPACNQTGSNVPPSLDQWPAATVYSKPIIILVDAFSISAADIFPAMMQDNKRGVVVGMRTSGGGGSVSSWPAGFYSEATTSNTNSLVIRNQNIVTAEYPPAPYVENIGTRPDIKLDYMTRENLMNGGTAFVSQFTNIIIDQIKKGQ